MYTTSAMARPRALVVSVGLLLLVFMGLPRVAHAASVAGSTFTLAGVTVTVSSSFMPSPTFTVAAPGAADQTAVSSTANPYRDLTLEATPFGTTSPGEGLPVATAGEAPRYLSALRSQRHDEGGTAQTGPSIDFFGSTTAGTVSQVSLALSVSGRVPVAIAEWVTQAGSQLWILRAAEQLTTGATTASLAALVAGLSVTASGLVGIPGPSPSSSPSPTGSPSPVAQPSPPPSASPSASPAPTPTPSPAPTPSSAPSPSADAAPARATSATLPPAAQATGSNAPWWNGVCDVGNNRDGFPLGAAFQGFLACGPRPYTESPAGASDYLVDFFPGAWGEYEFECVELVMRYLYLTYGIDPYPANGNQVVTGYSGSRLVKVSNGTFGQAPQAGDIISFGADTADGHAAVVTASAVDAAGNGSVTVIEENNSAAGSSTLTVSGWVVGPDAYPTIGWLHNVGSDGPTVAVNQSNGQDYVLWQAQDGGLWEENGDPAVWNGPNALNMGLLGSTSAAGVHSNGEQDVFWRGTNGDLWEAFSVSGTWYGPYDQGPGWDLGSEPSVAVNQSNGQEYVFWQGAGGGLWEGYWNGSGWLGPISLGMGVLGSAPTAGVLSNGQEDVYWRGTNGDLWEAAWTGARWNGPDDVGPGLNLGSEPSVGVNQGNGQEYVFWQATAGGGLDESYWNGSAWIGPISIGMGVLGSAPTAGVQANGQEDVYWRGGTGDLWVAFWANSRWNGPYDVGGSWNLDAAPSVAVNQTSGQQDVFFQGDGGGLWDGYADTAGWSGAASLSMGTLGSPPGAGVQSGGEVDVFWAGTNDDLWEGYLTAGGWNGPADRGPGWGVNGEPSVAVNQSTGREAVFWQGFDDGLWTSTGSGGSWSSPSSPGMGLLGSPPTAGEHPDGEQDVFWRGTNQDLWEAFSVGGQWYGPYDQGPGWGLNSQPSVAVNQANGDQYVFWEGADGGLWEGYWNGSAWVGPISIGMGPLGSAPAAGVQADGEVDVFWRGTTGDLWEASWANSQWNGPDDLGPAWNQ